MKIPGFQPQAQGVASGLTPNRPPAWWLLTLGPGPSCLLRLRSLFPPSTPSVDQRGSHGQAALGGTAYTPDVTGAQRGSLINKARLPQSLSWSETSKPAHALPTSTNPHCPSTPGKRAPGAPTRDLGEQGTDTGSQGGGDRGHGARDDMAEGRAHCWCCTNSFEINLLLQHIYLTMTCAA